MSSSTKHLDSLCKVERHKRSASGTLDIHTGRTVIFNVDWHSEPCGVPLFAEEERQAGVCRACRTGWQHPHNHTPEQRDIVACPLCQKVEEAEQAAHEARWQSLQVLPEIPTRPGEVLVTFLAPRKRGAESSSLPITKDGGEA